MGAVDTTYTFTATDTITSSKMNNIIDQTTITGDAIFENTLEVVFGKLKVRAQGIRSNELAADAVTSIKIAAGAITSGKLSTGGPTWDGGTTYMTPNLELGSNITVDTPSYIDMHSSSGTDFNARILRESGVNGNLVISNTGTGSIFLNSTPLGAQTGTAPIYGARAFGTVTSAGTAFESTKGNVASVQNQGSGYIKVTFTTPIHNTSYCVITNPVYYVGNEMGISISTRTTTYFIASIRSRDNSGDVSYNYTDFSFVVMA